jgi:hypothetical protein
MRAAIPKYMRFPALREMHQLSAAGTTLEAEVYEDGTTRIVAHVVDPVAVAKVKNQVYRGFSIGGRITQRDVANPKMITGLVLNEISLVDRPANPEAIFDCWKAAIGSGPSPHGTYLAGSTGELANSAVVPFAQQAFNSPIQIWACGITDHRHLVKADAVKCLAKNRTGPTEVDTAIVDARATTAMADGPIMHADKRKMPDKAYGRVQYADPGYQPDGKKRYPIETERHIRAAWNYINKPGNARKYTDEQLKRIRAAIIDAWKAEIHEDGPPSAGKFEKPSQLAITKALWDVCHAVRVIMELEWLKDALDLEAAMENDDSSQGARLQTIITELCDFLSALVTEETGELVNDAEEGGSSVASAMPGMLAMAAGVSGISRLAALLQKGSPNMRELSNRFLVKAKHSRSDQALLDVAYFACDKCRKIDGLTADESENLGRARDHLRDAGAVPISDPGTEPADDDESFPPEDECFPGSSGGLDAVRMLGIFAACLGKRGQAHQHMMDVAHECLSELTDGAVCQATKIGARHSKETMLHLRAAHRHLITAGAVCGAAGDVSSSAWPGAEPLYADLEFGKGVPAGDLTKLLAGERAEKAVLAKALGKIVPMLERLTKRVDDIARTPLPPLTMAKNTVSVSKQQDHNGSADRDGAELSPEAIAAALAKMSKEEQTLTLIKASYANPIRVLRSSADE